MSLTGAIHSDREPRGVLLVWTEPRDRWRSIAQALRPECVAASGGCETGSRLPICAQFVTRSRNDHASLAGSVSRSRKVFQWSKQRVARWHRSEEHTSELQSRENLVCRLLLEKKKKSNAL